MLSLALLKKEYEVGRLQQKIGKEVNSVSDLTLTPKNNSKLIDTTLTHMPHINTALMTISPM
jgi:hypothetical protein